MNLRFGLLVLVTVLGACTRREAGVSVRHPGGRREVLPLAGTLRDAWYVQNIDWQVSDNRLLDNLMEGLVRYDFAGGGIALAPGLATAWTSSRGGRTWTFRLREGVTWTDGARFTGQQVIDGWRRLLDPKTASPVAYFLFPIKNARAIATGTLPGERLGVRMSGPSTLVVDLETPVAFFPYLLTNAATFPLRADLVAKYGDQWSAPENLITLGAYRLVFKEVDNVTLMVRNTSYYGAADLAAAAPERVVAYVAKDEAEMNMFLAGQTDLITYLAPDQARRVPADVKIHRAPTLTVSYLAFATKRPPLDNVLIRRALAHAIDLNEVVKLVGPDQRPLFGWVPPGQVGHADGGLPFSVPQAKALLARAGVADPARLPRLEFVMYDQGDQTVAENIQFQLKRNLGVEVDLRYQEFRTLSRRTGPDRPHLAFYSWVLDFPDPDNMFALLLGASGNNHSDLRDAGYDRLVARAATLPTPAARAAVYREAQALILEREVAVKPLYAPDQAYLVGPRMDGFAPNPLGKILFRDLRLRR